MKQRFFQLSAVVLACAAMVGCAAPNGSAPVAPEAFNKALRNADAVAKAGDQTRALALYNRLTKMDPTREEPWSRIAQIQFQQSHYGQAIVAAQEALSRDQTDRDAKSVLAVSGLRVAAESLGQLRQDAALAGDAKSDAQVLAHQLRETLGESTLFPEEAGKRPVAKKRRYVRRPAAPAQKLADKAAESHDAAATPTPIPTPTPAKSAAPAQSAAAAKSGGASDPFSALR